MIIDRLIALLFGTVIGSASPVGADWLVRLSQNQDASPHAVIGHGQLYICTVSVLFAVFAVLLGDSLTDRARSLIGWPSLLVFGSVVVLYVGVSSSRTRGNVGFVFWSSLGFFFGAALLATASTVAAGWDRSKGAG